MWRVSDINPFYSKTARKHFSWVHLLTLKKFVTNSEAALQRCSWKKVFWKYAANLSRTPMSECDFNKVALQLYWNRTSVWVFSCNLLNIFRTSFPKNTPGWLLLLIVTGSSVNDRELLQVIRLWFTNRSVIAHICCYRFYLCT